MLEGLMHMPWYGLILIILIFYTILNHDKLENWIKDDNEEEYKKAIAYMLIGGLIILVVCFILLVFGLLLSPSLMLFFKGHYIIAILIAFVVISVFYSFIKN